MSFKNTSELTKSEWEQLIEYGLVDCPKNGFANTTKKADDLNIGAYSNTLVRLKGKSTLFVVRYYSGCFYPLWYKVKWFTHEEAVKINFEKDIKVILK